MKVSSLNIKRKHLSLDLSLPDEILKELEKIADESGKDMAEILLASLALYPESKSNYNSDHKTSKEVGEVTSNVLGIIKEQLKKLLSTNEDILKVERVYHTNRDDVVDSGKEENLGDLFDKQQDEPHRNEADRIKKTTSAAQVVNKIYRFVLPTGARDSDRQEFQRNIECIKQANPQWAVVPDWSRAGEEEAMAMIYKGDGNYLSRRTAYIVNQSLSIVLQGGYD